MCVLSHAAVILIVRTLVKDIKKSLDRCQDVFKHTVKVSLVVHNYSVNIMLHWSVRFIIQIKNTFRKVCMAWWSICDAETLFFPSNLAKIYRT